MQEEVGSELIRAQFLAQLRVGGNRLAFGGALRIMIVDGSKDICLIKLLSRCLTHCTRHSSIG